MIQQEMYSYSFNTPKKILNYKKNQLVFDFDYFDEMWVYQHIIEKLDKSFKGKFTYSLGILDQSEIYPKPTFSIKVQYDGFALSTPAYTDIYITVEDQEMFSYNRKEAVEKLDKAIKSAIIKLTNRLNKSKKNTDALDSYFKTKKRG